MKKKLLNKKNVVLFCLLLCLNVIYGQNLETKGVIVSGDIESRLYAFNCCIYPDSIVNYAGDIKVYILLKSPNCDETLYQLDPLYQKELKYFIWYSCELILCDDGIYSYKYFCKNLAGDIFSDPEEYILAVIPPID